jgi:L-asparaginase
MKKRIFILHTGGTIAMTEDRGSVKPNRDNPLLDIHILSRYAEAEQQEFANIPSPHMTPEKMFAVAQLLKRQLQEDHVDGAVVTHGTDTLEETAFMLDLLLDSPKPVVVTGAMRSSNEISADGPLNLLQSVRVAAADHAQKRGVMVVFNDEIHTARNVTKTHTSNISTFQSPQYGPIGIVTKHAIRFHQALLPHQHFDSEGLSKQVVLLKAFAGMNADHIRAITEGADGLVIEAFGQGNLPPATVGILTQLIGRRVPVVLVSVLSRGRGGSRGRARGARLPA